MNRYVRHECVSLALVALVGLTSAVVRASESFPLRAQYPTVQTLTSADLNERLKDVLVVDARAQVEFGVIHIVDAYNVDSGLPSFEETLARVRPKDGHQAIVFYCNDRRCKASYEAVVRAQQAGFTNVFCYDAGIVEWALAHPDATVLLGDTPADTSRLATLDKLATRTIGLGQFKQKARAKDAMVIDIRDASYRERVQSFAKGVLAVRLNGTRLLSALQDGAFKNRTLLLFDNAGRDVQWLQYYLEQNGYQRYWFLLGGAEGSGAQAAK